jgi:hypothetical protein
MVIFAFILLMMSLWFFIGKLYWLRELDLGVGMIMLFFVLYLLGLGR